MKNNAQHRPLKILRFLLQSLSLYDIHHSVLGDFEETFQNLAKTKNPWHAHLWYAAQVIRTLVEYIRLLVSTGFGLLLNYIRITLRNFKRNKFYSSINITGLAIGLAAVVLVFMYARFELSYDRFHPDADRIYRIVRSDFTGVPYILGERLKLESPVIEHTVRIKDITIWGTLVLETEEKQVLEDKLFMADPEFFQVFGLKFLSGDAESALGSPESLVLTESTARKYFGESDPLGKTVIIKEVPFHVTAVISDLPANMHLHFNALISTAAEKPLEPRSDDQTSWTSSNYKTYLQLSPDLNLTSLESVMNRIFSQEYEEAPALALQKLTDIHLYSHLRSEFEANGSIDNIRFAAAIACIILLVAVINFINLATAHSLHRSQEVGLRKVLGAQRSQLVRQFVGESLIYVFLSAFLGLGIAYSLLPYFQRLTGAQLGWEYIPRGMFALFVFAVILIVGLVAGSYPAFFVSRFQPVKALKGEKQTTAKRFPLRNIFVGVQFAVTIIFLCAAIFVWAQMRYMKERQLGNVKERIVTIELPRQERHHHQTIKRELLAVPGVIDATSCNFLPSTNDQRIGSTWEGRIDSEDIDLGKIAVDIDFIPTFNIEVVAGEPFTHLHPVGATYIVNETAARIIGDGDIEQAVGKNLTMHTWSSQTGRIIGVVRDFHYRSLHQTIEPMVLFLDGSRTITRPSTGIPYNLEPFRYVSARVDMASIGGILERIQEISLEFIPYSPEPWFFFDRDFDRLYAAEQRIFRFMFTLALTAVFLAAMGLLGLSIYAVENRRKEIGIRRVMGASTASILVLFFKDFLLIHLGAMLIAFPVIAYVIHNWLQNFAYRISLSPLIFFMGGLSTAILFFFTSSFNVYRNAAANPAESLRNE
jgi:putative ABC transport system permease protein